MSVKYTFSISNDTLNSKVDSGSLTEEIQTSAITVALDYIDKELDVCDVWFKAVLLSQEQTTLSGVLATHVGEPLIAPGHVRLIDEDVDQITDVDSQRRLKVAIEYDVHDHDDLYYTEDEVTTISGVLQNQIDSHMSSDVSDKYLAFGFSSDGYLNTTTPLEVTGGSTLGYLMPASGTLVSMSVLTDTDNYNDYNILKNGAVESTIVLASGTEEYSTFSIPYNAGDILSAQMTVYSGSADISDIDYAYIPDENALFLAHIDGDDKNLRHVTNSSTIAEGMTARLKNDASFTTSGPFDRCVDFDGTNDYVEILHHDDYNVQNTTVELFFKLDYNNIDQCIVSKGSSGLYIGAYNDHVYVDVNGTVIDSDQNLSANTWYHLAVVMGTGGLKVFLDGTSIDSDATTQGIDNNTEPISLGGKNLGADYFNVTIYMFNGKMAELRISNTRRYETNFTKPSSAFTNDANTLGLWHLNEASGALAYDSSDTIHNAMMMATGSMCEPKTDFVKFGTHAIKMNGSQNDWLRFNHISDYESDEITLEAWVRPHKDSRDGYVFYKGGSSTEGALQAKWKKGGTTLNDYIEVKYYGASTSRTLSTINSSFPKNEWHHLAIAIHAEYIKIFVDGTQQNAEGLTSDYQNVWNNNKDDMYIGASDSKSDYAKCYLDEIRVSNIVRNFGHIEHAIKEISMLIGVE